MSIKRILFVSDLHYTKKVFKGIDQGRAWEWLLEVVDEAKPDLILSAGDWDVGIICEEFSGLLGKVPVLSIYGNHENIPVLKSLRNPLLDNRPVLIGDGEVVNLGEFTVSGISGVLSKSGKAKRGVPRKTVEQFVSICGRLRPVTFLLVHEVPGVPELARVIRLNPHAMAVYECLCNVNAELILGGHIHQTPYTFHKGKFTYLRVDSSQKHKTYALIYPKKRKIEVFSDKEELGEFRY